MIISTKYSTFKISDLKDNAIPDFWADFTSKIDEIEKYAQAGLETKAAFAISELTDFVDNVLYEKIENNWILSSETLCEMLDLYINKKQEGRCYRIVYFLVRYYRKSLENLMQKWIKAEEYEKCKTLKTMIYSLY